jgi:hypothetical protein
MDKPTRARAAQQPHRRRQKEEAPAPNHGRGDGEALQRPGLNGGAHAVGKNGSAQYGTTDGRIPSPAKAGKTGALGHSSPVQFLQQLRRNGPWLLLAFDPDNGNTTAVTATTPAQAKAFVARHNGKRNIYYSLNPTKRPMNKKPRKADIAQAEFAHADLDPRANETPQAAKKRFLANIEAFEPKPFAIVDSGNGIQALWALKKAIPPDRFVAIEAASRALTLALGGTAGTQNVDRILRLPGTANLPTKAKRAKGRTECEAKLVECGGATCDLSTLEVDQAGAKGKRNGRAHEGDVNVTMSKLNWGKIAKLKKSAEKLSSRLNEKGRIIWECDDDLDSLNAHLSTNYPSWSEVTFALTALGKLAGLRDEETAALLCANRPCNAHVLKHETEREKRHVVERAVGRSYDLSALPKWRRGPPHGGKPGPILKGMHNARLAIAALGIECRYDSFHNKMLVSYRGVQHEMQPYDGEVSDHGIIALRQLISDRFGIEFKNEPVSDAVASLALEHRFDPVRGIGTRHVQRSV